MITNFLMLFGYDPLFSNVLYDHFPIGWALGIILMIQLISFALYHRLVLLSDRSIKHYVFISSSILMLTFFIIWFWMGSSTSMVSDENGYSSFVFLHALGFTFLSILGFILMIPISLRIKLK